MTQERRELQFKKAPLIISSILVGNLSSNCQMKLLVHYVSAGVLRDTAAQWMQLTEISNMHARCCEAEENYKSAV